MAGIFKQRIIIAGKETLLTQKKVFGLGAVVISVTRNDTENVLFECDLETFTDLYPEKNIKLCNQGGIENVTRDYYYVVDAALPSTW